MVKVKLILLLQLFSFMAIGQNFGGNPSWQKWLQINASTARVIFPNETDSQAKRILLINQLLNNTTLASIGNQTRPWNIVLLYQTTLSNAYVRLAPVISEYYMTPSQNNFSVGSLRWDDNLVIHENRHMQQFANFNKGFTKLFSFFLGQQGQLLANGIAIPDYFFEGDAVYQETLVSKQGRGRMPYFFNGLKSLWLSNANYSWMKLRSGSLKNYVPDHYELGYPLIAYGYQQYGNMFWRKVTEDAVKFKSVFYAFNKAIERHSGKSYQQFRQDALSSFKEKLIAQQPIKDESITITQPLKNNVVDYLYPQFIQNDSIIVTKQSYKEVSSFYILANGKERKIRVKDIVLDDYFSYRNGKVVYATHVSNPRWYNQTYSDITLMDIYTGQQNRITQRKKYFSPDISQDGLTIVAVDVQTNGANSIHLINSSDGTLTKQIPNTYNYFYTQTKFITNNLIVSAVRNEQGQMALVLIDTETGTHSTLTPFSYDVVGYPFVKGSNVYYSKMDALHKVDRIFMVNMDSKIITPITLNNNGVYHPTVSSLGDIVFMQFTNNGLMLKKLYNNLVDKQKKGEYNPAIYNNIQLFTSISPIDLQQIKDSPVIIKPYKKSFKLFNFHSARPFATDPEFGYSFYSDNMASTFKSTLSYTYNRNEQSSAVDINNSFAGFFSFLTFGAGYTFNRNIDTALGKGIQFNTAKVLVGASIPLQFIGGKTAKYFTIGINYSIEQIPYIGISKNVFNNLALKSTNSFISFSNVNRQARQHINPRWAQAFAIQYRHAHTLINNRKLVANSAFYLPGFATNHSLVANIAYQRRDTLQDLFSNNFAYSRGYQALNSRRMIKLGINYHFPISYIDAGIGNIYFIQRLRANAFFDYTNAKAKVNGILTQVISRSTGVELYVDGKIWNALPASIGIRYSRLLDIDLRSPTATGMWEIILPINLVNQ
jgi:hypothetical protein